MQLQRAASALLVSWLALAAAAAQEDILYDITEEQYYEMPQLFELDEYEGCLARRGLYCMATFELAPLAPSPLFTRMQRYSANWVDTFNHTRLHRAWCVSRRCPAPARPARAATHDDDAGAGDQTLDDDDNPLTDQLWFERCVNASTAREWGLAARLARLQYCERGPRSPLPPLGASEWALTAVGALLLALAAAGTALDLALSDQAKKKAGWALCWSLGACWRELAAPARGGGGGGALAVLDGLRALSMFSVLIVHVIWLSLQSYLASTWSWHQMRRSPEGLLMVNSTLVVQIFFLMSSFLLANKLLAQDARGARVPRVSTFCTTMLNRVIRVSPSYWIVVWWAAAAWERAGAGPHWRIAVGTEAAVCRAKWWTHLLYVNNIVRPDDKCLIQTWYLAADMQLYGAALALTLALLPLRRVAVRLLSALLIASVAAPFGMAYAWRLTPTYVLHRPELVRQSYTGEPSFNVLYQSPLSNAAGMLGGLLLAFVHHNRYSFTQHKVFRAVSSWGLWLAVLWAALSPRALGPGPPSHLAAAALAAVERPVFAFLVGLHLLGALNGVKSPATAFLSWPGWALPARLSFGVLLLHLPLYKTLVASRLALSEISRQIAFVESFGLWAMSGLAALALALLVELPAMRLHRALTSNKPPPPPADTKHAPAPIPAAPPMPPADRKLVSGHLTPRPPPSPPADTKLVPTPLTPRLPPSPADTKLVPTTTPAAPPEPPAAETAKTDL